MCNRTEPQTIEPWCHAMQSTQQCLYFNLGNAKKNALITNTIILNSKALPFSSKELLFLPLELKMFKDQVVLHALLQGPNNFCDSHSPPPLVSFGYLLQYSVSMCTAMHLFHQNVAGHHEQVFSLHTTLASNQIGETKVIKA